MLFVCGRCGPHPRPVSCCACAGLSSKGYSAAEYAHLPVSDEVKELFQYITRFKPHTIELETRLKPFIPDYIPAVGEIDAFLKVPRPLPPLLPLSLASLASSHPRADSAAGQEDRWAGLHGAG